MPPLYPTIYLVRLRLHFDGYGDSHDFWENADSENLFPAGWCTDNNQILTPPKGQSWGDGVK